MAAALFTSVPDPRVAHDLEECGVIAGKRYLDKVSELVSSHRNKHLPLLSPHDAVLKIVGLDGTIYSQKPDEVNGWGKFYLPKIVNMRILGTVKETSCQCEELVLMTCEDKKVYAYDGEELHVVASSLQKLFAGGMNYPSSESYYNGEAFKNMTERDWAEVKKGDVWKSLERDQRKLAESNKSSFLANLMSQK